jgi:hypothetical protein
MVRSILQMEGLLVGLAGLAGYVLNGGDLPLFALLFMTPDLAMAGYLRDDKTGAFMYDIVHNYGCAILIIGTGLFVLRNAFIVQYGFLLVSHISIDRFLGFGLKYPKGFKESHIQKL